MEITNKIDEYLNRKKKPVLKEQTEVNVNADLLELLNSLDDDFLDDRQLELRDRILSNAVESEDDIVVPENDIDNDGIIDDLADDGFDDEFATDDGYNEEDVATAPEMAGNKELFGYNEDDFQVAEGNKKKVKARKSFITEVKTTKNKKATKKTK